MFSFLFGNLCIIKPSLSFILVINVTCFNNKHQRTFFKTILFCCSYISRLNFVIINFIFRILFLYFSNIIIILSHNQKFVLILFLSFRKVSCNRCLTSGLSCHLFKVKFLVYMFIHSTE